MEELIIFTNNPAVVNYFEKKGINHDVRWVAAPIMEVLSTARAAILQGAVLLSEPLSGVQTARSLFSRPRNSRVTQLKPHTVNPLLTVATTKKQDTVDFASVKKIDAAVAEFKKNARLRFKSHNEDEMKDFQVADLEELSIVLSLSFD